MNSNPIGCQKVMGKKGENGKRKFPRKAHPFLPPKQK